MSDVALHRASSLPGVALALGIGALVVYWVAGLALDGPGWIVGFVLGLVAIVTGVAARRAADGSGRRMATIGLVVGAIPVVWFAVYMAVASL